MRFPFTFMGLLSLGIGAWIFVYLLTHHSLDPGAAGLIWMTGFLNVAFGSFVLARRLRGQDRG